MKHLTKLLMIILPLQLAVGCGSSVQPATSSAQSAPFLVPLAVNVLAGVAVKLFEKVSSPSSQVVAKSDLKNGKIGEAIPKDAKPNALSAGELVVKTYEANFEDGSSTPIQLKYQISYRHGVTYNGRGSYISNVEFVPLQGQIEKGWALEVSSKSQDPVNEGTAENPKYSLDFSLAFNGTSPNGSFLQSHRFRIRHADGKLIAVTPKLSEK
jgi:hypothetical protein